MRKLIISVTLLASICLLWFLAGSFSPAMAATNGQISGRMLDGTANNKPLANQSVTLQMAEGSSAKDVKTVKTDASGTYVFDHLDTDQKLSYAVFANYQGAQYMTGLVSLPDKPVQSVDLQVYEATSSIQNIAILQSTVLVEQPDTAKGTVTVSEALSFQNLNKKSYVGSLDASKGKPNALLFSTPSNVHNVTLGKGFDGYQVIQVNNGFATNAALLPGSNEFSFSYEIPYTSAQYSLTYQTQYPTVGLTFLVDTDLHASSSQLTSQGIVNANQQVYHSYQATGLAAQKNIDITLEGLPVSQSDTTSPSFNATSIWLLLVVVVLVAALVLSLFLYRSRKRRAQTLHTKRNHGTISGKTTKAMAESEAEHESTSMEPDHQQQLLEELLTLDQQYEAGKLNKKVYEERRGKAKARLRTLLSEQETSRR